MLAVDHALEIALEWCEKITGPYQLLSDDTQEHAGLRASALRLAISQGNYFLKLHRDPEHWQHEVHAYETWAAAFGHHAPRLLGAREAPPLALVISEIPGIRFDRAELTWQQEQNAWHTAGRALARLHDYTQGAFFGSCRRDGSPANSMITDPVIFLSNELDGWLARGLTGGWIDADLTYTAAQVRALLPAFWGERPAPCHRDYCPPNWMVEMNCWSGVIDFEFSYWDVRTVDLARFPNWDWMKKPDAYKAFLDGYYVERAPSPYENQQKLAAQALYGLGAVVWGMENNYTVFAREGREALCWLQPQLTAALA